MIQQADKDILNSLRKTREDIDREEKLSQHEQDQIKQSDQECEDQLDLLRNQRIDNAILKSISLRDFVKKEQAKVSVS